MTDRKRRRLIQAGLAAPLLRWNPAGAQPASGAVALLAAPRRALVIGNSAYRFAPLKNPANDARAIGEELKRVGFDVTLGLDLSRQQMLETMSAYVASLSKAKAVGLFYFAGHGVQLAWRNYLLPVDAAIAQVGDIQAKCVDVNAVIEGIGKAANPMNVIVLDACRDNPFGGVKLEQKGLSQLDAPPGTLLAYATAPGNLAADGEGTNGLYTEQLLREMRVPEAKIEDVFKRVRLAVRLRSNGQQLPWESTSLEQDFWFIPPKEMKKLSDAEKKRRFDEELAQWEKAKPAQAPAPLEAFLRRFPSGHFAELAQAQLDAVLARQGEQRIQIASAQGNPFTQGSARADTGYRVGDRYQYQVLDLYSRVVQRTLNQRVTGVIEAEVVYNNGNFVTDLLGNLVREANGARFTSNQQFPADFFVGKRWSTRFTEQSASFGVGLFEADYRITKKERVRVPAGSFDAFRIEGNGTFTRGTRLWSVVSRAWFAPDKVRRPVAREELRSFGRQETRVDRIELVAFRQGR